MFQIKRWHNNGSTSTHCIQRCRDSEEISTRRDSLKSGEETTAWKFSGLSPISSILRKLWVGAKGVVGEVERRVGVSPEHGGGAHELGGGHAMQVWVVAAHRVRQRVSAHPSHTHPGSKAVGTSVDPWWKETSDARTFLLWLRRQFPIPRLNVLFLQRSRPWHLGILIWKNCFDEDEERGERKRWAYIVEFVVESASVADGFPVCVSPPKSRCCCRAIRARRSLSLRWRLQRGEYVKM